MAKKRTITRPAKRVRGIDTIHKSKGLTSGVGICTYLADCFDSNALLAVSKKFTDEEIAAKVLKEFPTAKSATNLISEDSKLTINTHRTKYNAGGFTRGIPPVEPSFRYDSQGRIVNGRNGKYPLLPEEIDSIKKKHEARRQAIIAKLKD